jgi:hypothetical protein
MSLPTGSTGINHFSKFGDMIKTKKGGRVRQLIWLATTWNIWKHRNSVIFNGVIPNVSSLVDEIKFGSWIWYSSRYEHKSNVSFTAWCLKPLICIQNTL